MSWSADTSNESKRYEYPVRFLTIDIVQDGSYTGYVDFWMMEIVSCTRLLMYIFDLSYMNVISGTKRPLQYKLSVMLWQSSGFPISNECINIEIQGKKACDPNVTCPAFDQLATLTHLQVRKSSSKGFRLDCNVASTRNPCIPM